MNLTAEAYAGRKVVSLADYRRKILSGDDEQPPPSPMPAAARQPPPPSFVEAVGRSALAPSWPLVLTA